MTSKHDNQGRCYLHQAFGCTECGPVVAAVPALVPIEPAVTKDQIDEAAEDFVVTHDDAQKRVRDSHRPGKP